MLCHPINTIYSASINLRVLALCSTYKSA